LANWVTKVSWCPFVINFVLMGITSGCHPTRQCANMLQQTL